ncbi:hypothetical protein EJO68_11575 [Variovorax atrisoli]|uniref:hypothetical protein n=1 Tax=Variovorax atrisoli TaxID=3394203 RepID=UPI000F7EDB34|nr:hypothetical protein [Variovorax sp. 369]RTD94415.1 hypothetical protein EJO68_11575 [Variovorax sp. 369]
MATQNERIAAYRAWQDATEALDSAVFPPVGQQQAPPEVMQALVADLEQKLAAFKAAYGL